MCPGDQPMVERLGGVHLGPQRELRLDALAPGARHRLGGGRIAEAIVKLLGDPTAAQTMARAGRKRVEAQFSLRAKVDATEALYHRLVAGARA